MRKTRSLASWSVHAESQDQCGLPVQCDGSSEAKFPKGIFQSSELHSKDSGFIPRVGGEGEDGHFRGCAVWPPVCVTAAMSRDPDLASPSFSGLHSTLQAFQRRVFRYTFIFIDAAHGKVGIHVCISGYPSTDAGDPRGPFGDRQDCCLVSSRLSPPTLHISPSTLTPLPVLSQG